MKAYCHIVKPIPGTGAVEDSIRYLALERYEGRLIWEFVPKHREPLRDLVYLGRVYYMNIKEGSKPSNKVSPPRFFFSYLVFRDDDIK